MTAPRIPQSALDEIRAQVSLTDTIGRRVALKRRGREHIGLCPFHKEKTPSFTVNEDKGFFHCFGCGEHGDAIDFEMHIDNLTFPEAFDRLKSKTTMPCERRPAPPHSCTADDDARRTASALNIWRASQPGAGTLVERYLRARGITIAIPPSIKYAPGLKHRYSGLLLPALVAAIQAPNRSITGILRIFLTADGIRKAPVTKAKLMLGKCGGGAVRLGPVGARLAIGEGLESSLSVAQAHPNLSVWAALSTSGMRSLVLPPEVREVILCIDADDPGEQAARAAAERFVAEGRRVSIARPSAGKDFNDELMRGAA